MELNKLLWRQLKRLGLSTEEPPHDQKKWEEFIERINLIFNEADQDRYLIQRSMEISTQEMHELYNDYEFAQHIAHVAYWKYDLITRKVTWTKEFDHMIGRDLRAPIPPLKLVLQLLHPDDKNIFKDRSTKLYMDGQSFNMEIRVKNPQNNYTWYEITAKATIDQQGKVTRLEGIILDIQRYKDTEEKILTLQSHLLQTEKMATVGQLAAGVAHEINNPLSYILSNLTIFDARMSMIQELQTLNENLLAALKANKENEVESVSEKIIAFNTEHKVNEKIADIKDLLAESSEGLLRIKKIVSDLKVFASNEDKGIQETNINQCIDTALGIAWNQLKYKCTIHKNLSDLPTIQGYPNQLTNVIVNLLLNAADAIPQSGEITITTSQSGSTIQISITDTGSGIDPNNLNKIFTPFFTTKPVGSSKGMGLPMSYGIIKSHGGSISVNSKIDKGTSFLVELPIHKNE